VREAKSYQCRVIAVNPIVGRLPLDLARKGAIYEITALRADSAAQDAGRQFLCDSVDAKIESQSRGCVEVVVEVGYPGAKYALRYECRFSWGITASHRPRRMP
jgi:hypothetical protein